jgi:hypothetical protein
MNPSSPIRKVYQGIADRRQMFRMFDRHTQRPNRFEDADAGLYRGEWFELTEIEHDYMFNILPPLFMNGEMFAMREFLTGCITSVFFTLKIDDRMRFFHAYCDLADKGSPAHMRAAIVERESRPVRAMTREERIEHIWSSSHDEYRGYADWRFPAGAARPADGPVLRSRPKPRRQAARRTHRCGDRSQAAGASAPPSFCRRGVRGEAMFTFPIVAVRKVIDRGTADAAINGGFRNPYYGMKPGEGEIPGLWLVGDEGVYIMSNGKLAEGHRSKAAHPPSDNFYLVDDRGLRGWKERARDNRCDPARGERAGDGRDRREQEQLIRFTGFGASNLPTACSAGRARSISARAGTISAALWRMPSARRLCLARPLHPICPFHAGVHRPGDLGGPQRLGWRGGRVLEPGIGTGLFPALMPEACATSPMSPASSSIRSPRASPGCCSRRRADRHRRLRPHRSAGESSTSPSAIRPSPTARCVPTGPIVRLALRLHDYFIARSIDLLKPGALAAFVTSSGTMDKADATARVSISPSRRPDRAIRLPEGSFRATPARMSSSTSSSSASARSGEPEGDQSWLDTR